MRNDSATSGSAALHPSSLATRASATSAGESVSSCDKSRAQSPVRAGASRASRRWCARARKRAATYATTVIGHVRTSVYVRSPLVPGLWRNPCPENNAIHRRAERPTRRAERPGAPRRDSRDASRIRRPNVMQRGDFFCARFRDRVVSATRRRAPGLDRQADMATSASSFGASGLPRDSRRNSAAPLR